MIHHEHHKSTNIAWLCMIHDGKSRIGYGYILIRCVNIFNIACVCDTSVCVFTCKCAACLCMCVCVCVELPSVLPNTWSEADCIKVQKGSSSSVDIEKQKPSCSRLFQALHMKSKLNWLNSFPMFQPPLVASYLFAFQDPGQTCKETGCAYVCMIWGSHEVKTWSSAICAICNLACQSWCIHDMLGDAWWLASCFLHLLSDRDLGTVKHHGFLCDMLGVKMKTGPPRRLTQWCTMQIKSN